MKQLKLLSIAKKRILLVLVALLFIIGLSGTYAWSSYTDWRKNHMQSLGFDIGNVTIIEEFEGNKKPIAPEMVIKKEVNVINTSPVSAFVRVSFEEELQRLKRPKDYEEAVPTRRRVSVTSGRSESEKGSKNLKDQVRRARFLEDEFPVIIDAKEYYLDGRWKDETLNLKVTGINPPDDGLRLFIKGVDKVLLRETTLNKDMFPEDYNFDNEEDMIAFIIKSSTEANYATLQKKEFEKLKNGDDVLVAQKVTGYVEEVTKGKYEIRSGAPNAIWQQIGYHSYGAGVGGIQTINWAGIDQWVPENPKLSTGQDFVNKKIRLFGSAEDNWPTIVNSALEFDELDLLKIAEAERVKPENQKFEQDNWYNYNVNDPSGKIPNFINSDIQKSLIRLNLQEKSVFIIESSKDIPVSPEETNGNFKREKPYWLFNSQDNYFYYSLPLQPGETTKVPVIKSVTYPDSLRYNIAAYNLHIGSEAIPAIQPEMLTSKSLKGKIEPKNEDEYRSQGEVTVQDGSGFELDTGADRGLITYFTNLSELEKKKLQ